MSPDEEQYLKLLSIFHYVLAGITALVALFPIIHLGLGIVMVSQPAAFQNPGQPPPPAFMGWFFIVFAGTFIVIGELLALLMLLAGRSLAKRRRRVFCMAVAGMACINMPAGTTLGVLTIMLLTRPAVREAFGEFPDRA